MSLEIPKYKIKQTWLGELHPTTTEQYLERWMKGRMESIAIELHDGKVIAHAEQVVCLED